MEMELVAMVINSCLYCLWAYYYIRKKGLCVNTYPMVLWSASSLASIYYFLSEYRFHTFVDKITLTPYIYLFILVWISFVPLIRFDYRKIQYIKIEQRIYNALSVFIIILSLLVIAQNMAYFFFKYA